MTLSRRGLPSNSPAGAVNPPPHQPRRSTRGASVVNRRLPRVGESRVHSLPHPEARAAAGPAEPDARAGAAAARSQSTADLTVRPVSQTPTERADYAALTTVYGALLGAVAVSSRGREPVPRAEVPVLAAATFAL